LVVSPEVSWLTNFVDCWQDNREANLPEAFLRGLSTAHISGRAQIVHDSSSSSSHVSSEVAETSGDLIFYLDGAHSPESIEACAKWFSVAVKGNNQSPPLVLSSSHNIENINIVWKNGHVQHEKCNIQEFNKISKKVIFMITSWISLGACCTELFSGCLFNSTIVLLFCLLISCLDCSFWFHLLASHLSILLPSRRFFYLIAWRSEILRFCFHGLWVHVLLQVLLL